MATLYDELILALQEYCDSAATADDENRDLRVGFGTPGYRIEVRNEVQDTGQGYTTDIEDQPGEIVTATGIIQGVLWAVAHVVGEYNEHSIHDNVAAEFSPLTAKTAVADADLLLLEDSEDNFSKKKVTVASILQDWLTPVGPIVEESYDASYGELVTMRGP